MIIALVIVDVQAAFPIPRPLVFRIGESARVYDLCVFTRFVNPRGSLFRRKLGQHSCAPGSFDTQLLLDPVPGDLVFNKQGYGLTRPQIARLRGRGVTHAHVCGIDTDACVLGVMFSLFDAGLDCHVRRDLCWSSTGLHREALKIIAAQFPEPKRRRRAR